MTVVFRPRNSLLEAHLIENMSGGKHEVGWKTKGADRSHPQRNPKKPKTCGSDTSTDDVI